jgi:hypothetical protein
MMKYTSEFCNDFFRHESISSWASTSNLKNVQDNIISYQTMVGKYDRKNNVCYLTTTKYSTTTTRQLNDIQRYCEMNGIPVIRKTI